jgi:hypothetical protein
MQVTWISPNYVEGKYINRRYVRKMRGKIDTYFWVETNEKSLTVREGMASGQELPESIRKSCDAYTGAFYACEWP